MNLKHIGIPTVLFALTILSGCGNMDAGIRTFEATAQEASQAPMQEKSNESFGYYGYEEAMDTHEEEVLESISPKKSVPSTAVESAKVDESKEVAEVTPAEVEESVPEAEAEEAEPTPETKPVTPPKKEPAPSKVPGTPPSEVVGPGVLKPTVYYFAIINEDAKTSCAANAKQTMYGAGSKPLLKVCPKTAAACALQGSCGVIQKGALHTFNIIGRFDGQDRFFEIPDDGCRFGYGVRSSCLDPFYTLAADLTIYKPGEVIFVPAVVGLELPDGSKHSGYFVIRDKGRGIKGIGRFDFFSGHYSWNNPKNPFKKLGLGDVNTNIPYYRIKGEAAKKVLVHRSYPALPKHAVLK